MTTNIDLSGQEINDLDSNEMMDTFDVELGSLNPSNKFSRSFISQPSISRYSIFSDKGETSLRKESRGLESQNSSLAFFNAPTLDKRTSSFKYCYSEKKEWLCDSQIKNTSFYDYINFYFNSISNNQKYKFMFVQYMGELTMMYENCNKLIINLQRKDDVKNDSDENFLYFLHEIDDITLSFKRIDVFLERHLHFMKLCSAPVDLFIKNYYAARTSTCGLLEMIDTSPSALNFNCAKTSNGEDKSMIFYLHYTKCLDEDVKEDFLCEIESTYYEGSTKKYSTQRRIAALHNIIGELMAMSEFIKTTVDMNDQLLFRILMLFGSFLMLLGEFVWNTHISDVYYD